MIGAMAAVLLNGTAAVSAAVPANDLPQIFQDACLDGQARLSPGSATQIGFDALPKTLQQNLGTPTSAQIWQLNSPGRAYLYILQYPAEAKTNPRICGLASDAMDYSSAADAVEMRVTGKVQPKTMPTTEWLNPQAGYSALATRTGDFKVLQVNWLSDAQRAEILKAQAVIP